MRLQIKRLDGPDEILLSENQADNYTPQVNSSPAVTTIQPNTSNANQQPTTEIQAPTNANEFRCYLNRLVEPEDEFPLNVKLCMYEQSNGLIKELTLQVPREKIQAMNYFTFNLKHPKELSGTYIYVQAILFNAGTGSQNISISASYYHTTIKKVYLAAEKKINYLYWSSEEQDRYIDKEEGKRENIAYNEEGFIHIKAQGLYRETVKYTITAEDEEIYTQKIALYNNRKSITVSMQDMLTRYQQKKGMKSEEMPDTINLKLKIEKPNVIEHTISVTTKKKAENPTKSTHTGSIIAQVKSSDNENQQNNQQNSEYTDFLLGYMCHIEGIGKTAKKYNTGEKDTLTVYPFHIYEIKLSDLIACGLITIKEANYLTSVDNKGVKLKTETDLKSSFNKMTDKIDKDKKLLNVIYDKETETYTGTDLKKHTHDIYKASREKFRILLAQVQTKNSVNAANTIPKVICRDSWQTGYTRSESRYATYQECPYGEYFITYTPANYDIHIALKADGTSIANGRDGIAIHRGSSFYSVGCITFNEPYKVYNEETKSEEKGNHVAFNKLMFPNDNNKRLNLICIDERNAIRKTADNRYYDLIEPS